MKKCKFCNKEYTDKGIKYHEKCCKLNPDRKIQPQKTKRWYESMKEKKEKGTARNAYTKAKELGVEYTISDETRRKISKSSSKHRHSEETKKKLSEIRIKYLREHPDKVPYKLNHYSKGSSYPENYWRSILENNDIKFEEQYQVSVYQLDFAILSSKIDLEIDGDQHYLDERIVKSDKRRTKYLEKKGWTIIRIKWSDYQKLNSCCRKDYVNEIITQLK